MLGDRDQFRRLFEEHRDSVYRFLYRLARDRHDAEDLLQETFARLWRKRAQFRGEGSLNGYLRRIAYRTYLNARSRLARGRAQQPLEAEPAARGDGPAETAGRRELREFLLERVRREVDDLPDSWREPFLLFRYEGLTLNQTAETLGITPKAAELRVTRALKRIAERLAALRAEHGEWPR